MANLEERLKWWIFKETSRRGNWKGEEPWSAMTLAIDRRNLLDKNGQKGLKGSGCHFLELFSASVSRNHYRYLKVDPQVPNFFLSSSAGIFNIFSMGSKTKPNKKKTFKNLASSFLLLFIFCLGIHTCPDSMSWLWHPGIFPRLDHLQCPSHLLSSGVVESLTLFILATTPAAGLHLPCASPNSASAPPSCETDVHWLALPLHSGRETVFDRQRGSWTSLASLKLPSIVNALSAPYCKATVCPFFWLLPKFKCR